MMTVDLGAFALVNVYTPNSGEGLKRLGFRVGTWDRAFEGYLKALQAQGKQVLVCGDLNVAHGVSRSWDGKGIGIGLG